MLKTTIDILFWLFFLYCVFSVSYLFLLAVCGNLFYRRKIGDIRHVPVTQKIAILVPGYKEDGIIVSSAAQLLLQQYPRQLFDIFIIADSFQPSTLQRLRELDVHVLEVVFEKSTKLKSLDEAFSRIHGQYDIALICDSDNVLGQNVLLQLNACFVQGSKAIQAQRVAKNLDTPFAILDGCSEAINNHIFRKGANALGLSSSIIGSGMAFSFPVIKQVIQEINTAGSVIVHEDKILQLKIIEQGINIHYLEGALVFDEKVDSPQAFKQQRKRWVLGQFLYLKQFFLPAMGQLFKGNISYFNIAVLHNLVLPRAFMFVILLVLIPVSFLMNFSIGILATLLWMAYLLTMFLSLPRGLINKELLNALLRLPRAILLMVATLFRMKKANDTFIHTVHTRTEVSNKYLTKTPDKKG
ncbi:MAG: glycosyltransferase family 2 protein [Chitinophagaceae bacterium]|nr:glycosyltransferase family 2 protein [Chitinophagaceae bacterium]